MQSSGAFSLARRTNAWYAGTGCEKLKNVELPEITIAPGFLSDKEEAQNQQPKNPGKFILLGVVRGVIVCVLLLG